MTSPQPKNGIGYYNEDGKLDYVTFEMDTKKADWEYTNWLEDQGDRISAEELLEDYGYTRRLVTINTAGEVVGGQDAEGN